MRKLAPPPAERLALLPPADRAEWSAERAEYERACGCEWGAVGAGVGLLFTVGWVLAAPDVTTRAAPYMAISLLLLLPVAGAVIGKSVALLRARERYRRVTARLVGVSPFPGAP